MSSPVLTRSERILQRKRGLAADVLARIESQAMGRPPSDLAERVLPGLGLPVLNRVGREQFLALGAPVRQDEYWKYTDPARFLDPEPYDLSVVETSPFDGIPGPRVRVGSDGIAVDGELPDGLRVLPLCEAAREEDWLEAFSTDPQMAVDPVPRPLAALNAAVLRAGVAVRAVDRVSTPVHVIYEADAAGNCSVCRAAVRVDPGASLQILEWNRSPAVRNGMLQASVEEGGRLDHLRVQRDGGRREYASAFVRLGARAAYAGFNLSVDGDLSRNESVLHLAGEGATGHVGGGILGAGRSHSDTTVLVVHSAENCESRQVVRGVFDDRARGVFQGKVLVEQAAQKTDGYQISQAVLLDERSEFSSKPELEIYADDVKCSHGSTTGALDADALFYLRSRGLGKSEAEAILVAAFLEEALEEIADPAAADAVRAVCAEWMRRRQDGSAG